MGKVIAVASGKGGTGKTTTVAAVSSCLAALGYKTLCVDFDAELRNLDLALCMTDYAVADFMDVLSGRMELMEACFESPKIRNLFFLSAPQFSGWDEPEAGALTQMFDDVRNEFDYCLIDAPSGIGTGFEFAQMLSDLTIIVTTGEVPAMRDAQRAAEAARDLGVSDTLLLVNRVLPGTYRRMRITVDSVIDTVGARLLGIVREDDSVAMSLHENTPLILYKRKHAAYDFLDAARRLSGEYIPLQWTLSQILFRK